MEPATGIKRFSVHVAIGLCLVLANAAAVYVASVFATNTVIVGALICTSLVLGVAGGAAAWLMMGARVRNAHHDRTRVAQEREAAVAEQAATAQRALDNTLRMLDTAQEDSRLKSHFLATVSHELRTPLNAMINMPATMLKQYESMQIWHCRNCQGDFESDTPIVAGAAPATCPDCHLPCASQERVFIAGDLFEHRHFLRRLDHSGRRLLNLVNDLLDYSKLEARKMRVRIEPLELGALFNEVEQTLAPLATQKKIQVHYPQLPAPLWLQADPLKVEQIFFNLVGNAIKVIDEGGVVTVDVTSQHTDGLDWLRFSVTDDGPGIPKARLDDIFRTFESLERRVDRAADNGTGLGLAITKQLIELHRGRVWAESDPESGRRGSTFFFLLPRDGPDAVPIHDAAPALAATTATTATTAAEPTRVA